MGRLEETTIAMARAEIEGRTSGVFGEGFAANLANAARREIERERGNREREGRENHN